MSSGRRRRRHEISTWSSALRRWCETDAVDDRLSFDPEAFELFRNGQIVDIEPQALTVAAYLIQHRHRLVPKEELLDEIWGDRFVSESALTTRIKQIRRAMGDNGTEQRVVKTIHGKGYRFVGEIRTASARSDGQLRDFDGNRVDDEGGSHPMVHNLPRLRTEMFGRGPEMELAAATISRNRLTTMVGVGGVGKTTLAIATGQAMLDSFAQGVCFVDLTTVRDADQLPLAIAKAAGLSLGTGNALDQVARIVGGRHMLFVIDNCEHVVDAVAETIDRLLDTTSAPRFLLTSREPLSLPDEARVVVNTLPTDSDGPAVQLLGACAARYGFAHFDRSTAADVCLELDGLPLAIELAAAQLRHLSLDDLASRLDQRLDLLVDPRRDRHSSLATVLEATWALIENPEREVLRQLAACPGALSLSDLIEIMDQPESKTLNALARLVDCSLLIRSMDSVGEYRMLETVRVFARDNDGDMQPQRRERLAAWCLEHVGTNVLTHAFDFGLAEWCRAHEDILDAAEAHLAADRPDDAAYTRRRAGSGDASRRRQPSGRFDPRGSTNTSIGSMIPGCERACTSPAPTVRWLHAVRRSWRRTARPRSRRLDAAVTPRSSGSRWCSSHGRRYAIPTVRSNWSTRPRWSPVRPGIIGRSTSRRATGHGI